jgi:hypothetical protein
MKLGKEKQMGDVDLIHLAQDWEIWWAVVSKVLNLWVPYEASRGGLSYLARLKPR